MQGLRIQRKVLENYPTKNENGDEKRAKESTLYYKDDKVYKVLNEELLDREETIIRLETLKGKELILPEYLLFDENGFIGYVMHYFKEHKQLANFIFGKLPFAERKRICLELCKIFTSLKKQGFAYYDIHLFNILYKDGDIKITDMDHGRFKTYESMDNIRSYDRYTDYAIMGDYNLGLTILALLFENYREYVLNSIKANKRELLRYSPKKIGKLYKHLDSIAYGEFDVRECIEDIDEDYIEGAKLILKK